MNKQPLLRAMEEQDLPSCLAIYNHYVETTLYSLEAEALTLSAFTERMHLVQEQYPALVCETEGEIAGFAYLSPFSPRYGYRFTCDLSVYASRRGEGIGPALTAALLEKARKRGLHDVIAIVTDRNAVSLAMHHGLGFHTVAHFQGIAEKFGTRLGVYYLQKTLG